MSWSQDTTSRLLITNKKYMTFLYTLNKPTPPKSKNKKKIMIKKKEIKLMKKRKIIKKKIKSLKKRKKMLLKEY